MAISETKGRGWRAIPTQYRKASDILTSTLAAFLFSSHPKRRLLVVLFSIHFRSCVLSTLVLKKQEAFEKCWAHSPLRAAIHQVSLLSHASYSYIAGGVRCPRQRRQRQQRQRVTEGTAIWPHGMGPMITTMMTYYLYACDDDCQVRCRCRSTRSTCSPGSTGTWARCSVTSGCRSTTPSARSCTG